MHVQSIRNYAKQVLCEAFLECYRMLVDDAEEKFGPKTLICSEDVLFCLVSHLSILLLSSVHSPDLDSALH
jgi:hypothetical protein